MGRLEDLQAKLDATRKEAEAARAAQSEADEIAALEAKVEYGEHRVSVIRFDEPAPGLPTLVVVKAPEAADHKRYRDLTMRGNPKDKMRAVEYLQADCRLYPDDAAFAELRKVFLDLPDVVTVRALDLAKGGASVEGKE